MGRIRPKLTYANVMVTTLAFIVLGGGAYAATQLPKNSVGSKQIRKGSIKPSDLSARAKRALAGATGPRGAEGRRGPEGAQGPQGPPGPQGLPSDAFVKTNAQGATIGCCARTTILTADVPAGPGRYLLVFRGAFTSTPESIGYPVPLYIRAGGTDLDSVMPAGAASFEVSMNTDAVISGETELAVDIDTVDTDQQISYAPGSLELIAVKVGVVRGF
jgi:hypothetical protein